MHFLEQVSTNLERAALAKCIGGRDTERKESGLCDGHDVLIEHVGDHLDLGLCCCDLLLRAGLRACAAEAEEGHVCEWGGILTGCGISALQKSLVDCLVRCVR